MWRTALVSLIEVAALGRRVTPATMSRLCSGSGDMHARLRAGRDITSRRAERIVRWLSDHWPAGAEWPPGVPRPAAATPDSPPAGSGRETPECQIDDPVAAARAAYDRMVDAVGPAERHAAAAEALAIGARLDPRTGQIASPAALCAALGVRRQLYYDAVRRHRAGGRPPRPGSQTAHMLAALQRAGDVRFTSRKEGAA